MSTPKRPATEKTEAARITLRAKEKAFEMADPEVHLRKEVGTLKMVCETDSKGHATPQGLNPLELVVDASEGFIPLWEEGTVLRWRFNESSLHLIENVETVKMEIEMLLRDALALWGDAVPVKFSKNDDAWDFEIVVREADRCNINGCVLASAFFPDPGRHKLVIYPKMFEQSRDEQIETIAHEVGHIFGLRHFFAQISEKAWRSEKFGKQNAFSIMNYGDESIMTDADRKDLKELYRKARNKELKAINGTPIRLVKPFHTIGES